MNMESSPQECSAVTGTWNLIHRNVATSLGCITGLGWKEHITRLEHFHQKTGHTEDQLTGPCIKNIITKESEYLITVESVIRQDPVKMVRAVQHVQNMQNFKFFNRKI